jgi:hypothetical protein
METFWLFTETTFLIFFWLFCLPMIKYECGVFSRGFFGILENLQILKNRTFKKNLIFNFFQILKFFNTLKSLKNV